MATFNLFMTPMVNSIITSLMVSKRSLPITPEQPQATRMAAVGGESAGARVRTQKQVSDTGSFTPNLNIGTMYMFLIIYIDRCPISH